MSRTSFGATLGEGAGLGRPEKGIKRCITAKGLVNEALVSRPAKRVSASYKGCTTSPRETKVYLYVARTTTQAPA